MTAVARFAVRTLTLAPVLPSLAGALALIAWWSIYFSIPALAPFMAYQYTCNEAGIPSNETIFKSYGWLFSAGYLVVVAALTAAVTHHKPYKTSLSMLPASVALLALIVHLSLDQLGFCYWMDSP